MQIEAGRSKEGTYDEIADSHGRQTLRLKAMGDTAMEQILANEGIAVL